MDVSLDPRMLAAGQGCGQVTVEHERLLGKMMVLAPKLALEQGCNPYPEGGFRIVCNTGAEGGQEVHHLHVHVMGGPRPWIKG